MQSRYLLDKDNGKLMGVCSGFANWSGIDPTIARVTAVVLALIAPPFAIVAYIAAGLVAPQR